MKPCIVVVLDMLYKHALWDAGGKKYFFEHVHVAYQTDVDDEWSRITFSA